MRKTMIAVAAVGALGMATMATSTMAFGHGGGGHGGGAGHFGGAKRILVAAILPAVSRTVTSAEVLGTGLAAYRPITGTTTAAATSLRPMVTLGSATETGGAL